MKKTTTREIRSSMIQSYVDGVTPDTSVVVLDVDASIQPALCSIIQRIKAKLPTAQIVVRADSSFCTPRLLDALEELDRELGDVDYVFGVAESPRLLALASDAIDAARERFEATRADAHHLTTFGYAAEAWLRERHVIAKIEHREKGSSPRFIVTTLEQFPGRMIFDAGYCARAPLAA